MPRIDQVAYEIGEPDRTAAFYERIVRDPDGRQTEVITYSSGDDPRRS